MYNSGSRSKKGEPMSYPTLTGLLRCEIRWKRLTGVARDDQINTFFVGTSTLSDPDLLTAAQGAQVNMRNFLDGFMSSHIFAGAPLAHRLIFNMLDAEPRIPIDEGDMGAGSLSAAEALPEEVSMVVSFEGPHISGESQRRRRGRMYLPTFTVDDVTHTTSVVWASGAVSNAVAMMEALTGDLETAGAHLVVFSRVAAAAAGGTLLNQARAGATIVSNGWVDDEPDTQRRRGRPSGTRTAWTV